MICDAGLSSNRRKVIKILTHKLTRVPYHPGTMGSLQFGELPWATAIAVYQDERTQTKMMALGIILLGLTVLICTLIAIAVIKLKESASPTLNHKLDGLYTLCMGRSAPRPPICGGFDRMREDIDMCLTLVSCLLSCLAYPSPSVGCFSALLFYHRLYAATFLHIRFVIDRQQLPL